MKSRSEIQEEARIRSAYQLAARRPSSSLSRGSRPRARASSAPSPPPDASSPAETRHSAARTIQTLQRRRSVEVRFTRNWCSRVIQRSWRGRMARKQVRGLRQDNAARRIQDFFREGRVEHAKPSLKRAREYADSFMPRTESGKLYAAARAILFRAILARKCRASQLSDGRAHALAALSSAGTGCATPCRSRSSTLSASTSARTCG